MKINREKTYHAFHVNATMPYRDYPDIQMSTDDEDKARDFAAQLSQVDAIQFVELTYTTKETYKNESDN